MAIQRKACAACPEPMKGDTTCQFNTPATQQASTWRYRGMATVTDERCRIWNDTYRPRGVVNLYGAPEAAIQSPGA